ncbi:hypothetical protein Godav_012615 [Gossypium davidsonii]|uniref:Uncharacterized protein n=1 Tax=Gossypium davidsonii TaxID=34287 RepID=A0A7J8RF30_GOSDV|nr:hypothetical protein [Gossypium davidsonii]
MTTRNHPLQVWFIVTMNFVLLHMTVNSKIVSLIFNVNTMLLMVMGPQMVDTL